VHRDALVQALPHAVQRLVDEGDPAGVVVGRDAAFGHIDRLADRRVGPADRVGQGLRIELVAGQGQLGAGRRRAHAVLVDDEPGVGLDAEEVGMGPRDLDPVAVEPALIDLDQAGVPADWMSWVVRVRPTGRAGRTCLMAS
jgi:hypothetical protein